MTKIDTRLTDTFQLLGRRWSLPILRELDGAGTLRFQELVDRIRELSSIALSDRNFSDNLSSLCEAGLLSKRERSTSHVSYAITKRGRQLLAEIERIPAIEQPRRRPKG